MRKQLSLWMVIAWIGAGCLATTARADLGGTVTYTEPAGSLVMPFDSTTGKASFQLVVREGAADISGSIATHWAYWAADCKHLADVVICLTPRDTVVVDPTALHGEVQRKNTNVSTGPVIDLSGSRGMVTVTAYEADKDCRVASPPVPLDQAIVGSWTIANTTTNTSYGGDAIGFPVTGVLPDPAILAAGGLRIPTLDPSSLTDSQVIVIPVKFPGGNDVFTSTEVGPLSKVACDTAFVDNLENSTSLPNVAFKCVGFNPIVSSATTGKDAPIIPDTIAPASSGFLQFSNCGTSAGPLSGHKFVFAFHGQAVGPFGTVVAGKYTNLLPDVD